MPGITAAAFISGNIDTDFTFVIESPLLVTIGFAANGTGQGAGILIVHGYTTYSRLRFEFIAGDKSSQGDKERDEIKPAPGALTRQAAQNLPRLWTMRWQERI